MSDLPRRRRASAHDRPSWLRHAGAGVPAAAVSASAEAARARRRLPTRALCAVLAAAETALLGWFAISPLFAPTDIRVSGLQRLTAQQVLAAGGVMPGASIFTLDRVAIEQRLEAQSSVQSATVGVSLPGTLSIAVAEWQPVAVFQNGQFGVPLYVTERGTTMAYDGKSGRPLQIYGPAGTDAQAGQRVIDPSLLRALLGIQRSFPGLVNQRVRRFELDSCGNLVLVTMRGWQVQFGRVRTPDELATLPSKLAALKAVAGAVNLNSPQLDYVNVMNPAAPAIRRGPTPAAATQKPGTSGSITINGNIQVNSC